MVAIDVTGQRYGRLTVLEYAGVDNHRTRVWKCRCDCGNITIARVCDLRNGSKQSCGCLKKDHLVDMRAKWAEMRASGKGKGKRPLFDVEVTPITDERKAAFDDWWMFGGEEEIARLRKIFR